MDNGVYMSLDLVIGGAGQECHTEPDQRSKRQDDWTCIRGPGICQRYMLYADNSTDCRRSHRTVTAALNLSRCRATETNGSSLLVGCCGSC